MTLTLTPREQADILRRRRSKGLAKIAGPKLAKTDTGKADRGRVRDNAFLAYLRRQPCAACGSTHRVEAAHIRSGYPEAGWGPTGMQVKPSDQRAASLCASCHREGPNAQHRGNERAWWAALGIYPPTYCAEVYADFTAGRDQQTRGMK
jgi:hypothetical protein